LAASFGQYPDFKKNAKRALLLVHVAQVRNSVWFSYHEVREVPTTDICGADCSLFDHRVGALLELQRYVEAEHLCGLEVDH
jgi:hypothetical protein